MSWVTDYPEAFMVFISLVGCLNSSYTYTHKQVYSPYSFRPHFYFHDVVCRWNEIVKKFKSHITIWVILYSFHWVTLIDNTLFWSWPLLMSVRRTDVLYEVIYAVFPHPSVLPNVDNVPQSSHDSFLLCPLWCIIYDSTLHRVPTIKSPDVIVISGSMEQIYGLIIDKYQ
jgi:hypothetical protein